LKTFSASGWAIYKIFKVLSKRDQRYTFVALCIQVMFGLMDLLGVALVGVLGALTVSGIQSGKPGNRVSKVLEVLRLEELSFQQQVTWIGMLAAGFLILRTVLSAILTKKVLGFLANRGAKLSSELVSKFLAQPISSIQSKTSFEHMYSLTTGVWIAVLEVLGTCIVMASDLSLLLIMLIGLLVIDSSLAILTTITFVAVGGFMYKVMHNKAKNLGEERSRLEIASNQKISEVIGSYRESIVRGRRYFYAKEIGQLRFDLSRVEAESSFMPYISKYVIETTVIVGALAICAVQFVFNDAIHAIATLSVFLAAGSRIAPAVLRLQQGAITVRSRISQSRSTVELIAELKDTQMLLSPGVNPNFAHFNFESDVEITDIEFTYPGKVVPAISIGNVRVKAGQSLAIVGPSGAGKTTLVDVLLGILPPQKGSIKLGGLPPSEVISKWPGSISYVPQDVAITPGTIRQNVALGFDVESQSDELIYRALKLAQMEEFVKSMPDGIDTVLSERGGNISGGQRQRLGIARALFTNPRILVLDEATSALDGNTEAEISDAIMNLKGETTVIVIAHRLASVRNCDEILYLEDGKAIAVGTFEEVRKMAPNFEKQALLMGLNS
jgi:ABC-type multidrug transport system fused ATPase/permease subunit